MHYFARFDETIDCISGISHGYITADTMKKNMNWLAIVLKVVICFIITNRSHEGFVKFCVIEVFKFWARSRWMKE